MELPDGFIDGTALQRAGVYLLVWKDEVVYAGQSAKLSARISTHISQKGKPRSSLLGRRALPTMRFDRIFFMPCNASDMLRIESELIAKYQPRYNIRKISVPTMSLDMLVDMMPVTCLPAQNPEPPRASWRRL
jgi:excinuclease UvrABC nuclease subunit